MAARVASAASSRLERLLSRWLRARFSISRFVCHRLMSRIDLERIRYWATARLSGTLETQRAVHQYVKLPEITDSILAKMDATKSKISSRKKRVYDWSGSRIIKKQFTDRGSQRVQQDRQSHPIRDSRSGAAASPDGGDRSVSELFFECAALGLVGRSLMLFVRLLRLNGGQLLNLR
jgi:hypothetical protein